MGCYLCAYQKTNRPKRLDPLPPASPVAPGEDIGSCSACSVAACSLHGSRYGTFKCAMCEAARAALSAMANSDGGDGPDVAQARIVGAVATRAQRNAAQVALHRIADDYKRAQGRPAEGLLDDERPNLVTDLASAVRGAASREVMELTVEEEPERGVSLEAIGAAVRSTFADVAAVRPGAGAVKVATGALLMAVVVAHRANEGGRVAPAEVDVPPPWRVTDPPLVDPVIWLLATAYQDG
jgi:hypothetical protein